MAIHLYWFSLNRRDGKENFGDLLSYYLVKNLSRRKVVRVRHPSMRRYKYFFKNFLTIGSILEMANSNSVVWGSGIMKRDALVEKAKFLAVRGPLTRKRLMELGYSVPEVYGDPAILLPKVYPKKPTKKIPLGIVPHYVDTHVFYERFGKGTSEFKIIDLITNNVESTIDEILECEFIVTSSLHGLIVAHTYGIPALWLKFSIYLGGDDVKFYDYFKSLGIKHKNTINVDRHTVEIGTLMSLLKENERVLLPDLEMLEFRRDELLKSFPY